MFSLICAWINDWVNNREAGDLRRHRGHYDVNVMLSHELHQPKLWFITGGYLVKRLFIPAAARARGQSNDLNREILASNLFSCRKQVINAPTVPSISRCIHIVYRHKDVWEYQWSNIIYNCMSTFLHYVHCKDALLDCSAPGGERCESLTWVDEIVPKCVFLFTTHHISWSCYVDYILRWKQSGMVNWYGSFHEIWNQDQF